MLKAFRSQDIGLIHHFRMIDRLGSRSSDLIPKADAHCGAEERHDHDQCEQHQHDGGKDPRRSPKGQLAGGKLAELC